MKRLPIRDITIGLILEQNNTFPLCDSNEPVKRLLGQGGASWVVRSCYGDEPSIGLDGSLDFINARLEARLKGDIGVRHLATNGLWCS